MGLQDRIENYINEIDASFGISIKHLKTAEEVHIGADRLFQMASVVKVPVLVKLYHLAEQGKVNLADRVNLREEDIVPGSGVFQAMDIGLTPTIKDLATMMMIVSDNLATDKILSIVGGVEAVQKEVNNLGLEGIYINQTIWELLSLSAGISPEPNGKELSDKIIKCLEEGNYDFEGEVFQEKTNQNVSTARAMNLLIEKIALGEVISKECSTAMLDILLKQQYQQRIGGLLPRNTTVANKTGSLGTIYNDTGIVYLPGDYGSFAITMYSNGASLDYKGDEALARISQIAYEYFMGNKLK